MAERRIESLDTLRGVAILGTMGTNIWIFTDPGRIIGFLSHTPWAGSLGDTVELVARFLANGKFLALLALLFGVGLELAWLDHALLYRSEAVIIVPSSVVLFLLGSRLLRGGVSDDSVRGRRLRTRLMVGGLGVAIPLNLATTLAGPEWVLLDRYLLAAVRRARVARADHHAAAERLR